MPRQTERGFTMVETMVAGGLLLSMSLAASLWLTGASDLWWTTTIQSQVRTDAQQALNRMVSELRSGTRLAGANPPAPSIRIPAAPDNTSITFYLPTDLDLNGLIVDAVGNTEWDTANPIQYISQPATGRFLRVQGAAQVVLANDVSSVTFEDQAINPTLYANEVKITLTLQRTTPGRRVVSATAIEIVKLRN